MLKKISTHIERWAAWKKYSPSGPFYNLLVLVGVVQPPTFSFIYTKKEIGALQKYILNSRRNR